MRRHDPYLLISGLADLLVGLVLLFDDDYFSSATYTVVLRIFDLHVWGVVFVLVGALGLLGWHAGGKARTYAYVATIGVNTLWAVGITLLMLPFIEGQLPALTAPVNFWVRVLWGVGLAKEVIHEPDQG